MSTAENDGITGKKERTTSEFGKMKVIEDPEGIFSAAV